MQSLACLLSFIHILKKSILKKKSYREKFKYSMIIFSFETFGSKEIDVAYCPEFFLATLCGLQFPSEGSNLNGWLCKHSLNHWTIREFLLHVFNVYFYKEKLIPETFWENYMEFFQSFIIEFIEYI